MVGRRRKKEGGGGCLVNTIIADQNAGDQESTISRWTKFELSKAASWTSSATSHDEIRHSSIYNERHWQAPTLQYTVRARSNSVNIVFVCAFSILLTLLFLLNLPTEAGTLYLLRTKVPVASTGDVMSVRTQAMLCSKKTNKVGTRNWVVVHNLKLGRRNLSSRCADPCVLKW